MKINLPPGRTKRGGSLRIRLVAAFMAVGVLSTLAATLLGTWAVTTVFERNVETWLSETSELFIAIIEDQRREALSVATRLAETPISTDDLANNKWAPPQVTRLIEALGYDVVAIYDRDHHPIYTSNAKISLDAVPSETDSILIRAQTPNGVELLIAGVEKVFISGRTYILLVGQLMDENFIAALKGAPSLEFRLYLEEAGKFIPFFGTHSKKSWVPLPDWIRQSMISGVGLVYDKRTTGGEYRGAYRKLLSRNGNMLGVIYCGLRYKEAFPGWLNFGNVFIAVLLVGGLLSALIGFVVSRRLAQPLRGLAMGVRSIAAQDYTQRVPVQGGDEVAELAESFNAMAERLEHLRAIETELRRRDRLSALGEVAVGIAHEVRNPLGTIKTSADLIRKRGNFSETDQRLFGHIIDEVMRIDDLIREFLAFARPAPALLKPMKPKATLERLCEIYGTDLTQRGVEFRLIDKANNPTVMADKEQLFQAFLNIVLNAADAMPSGGRLDVTLRRAGPDLTIEFADTGQGIPPEAIDRIFDPFFTTKPQGAGLGLAKVFSIMKSHHGLVECATRPTGGAVFIVKLPIHAEAVAEHDAHDFIN